jgi:hypothetical protein
MKKFILLIALATSGMVANAQLQEGSILATGGFDFESSSSDGSSSSAFSVGLNGGYFIQDNFALGLTIGYGSDNLNFGFDDASVNLFAIGAFARYYIPYNDNFAFFGQGQLAGSFGSEGAADISNFIFSVAPGFAYFFTERIALDMSVGVLAFSSNTISTSASSATTTQFDLGANLLTPRFGLSVFF